MLTRILAVTLAAGSLAFATAHAQTGTGTPGSNQSHQQMAPSPETTKPGTVPTTVQTTGTPASNQSHQQMAPSPETTQPSTAPTTAQTTGRSEKTGPNGGPTDNSSGQTQAQQPMGSVRFDPSQYKTNTECLNAASTAHASFSLCNSLK